MSGKSLGRGQGTAISCNGEGCTERSVTGQIRRKSHRAHLKTIGWGRGSDRGQEYRAAEPEREEKRSMTRGGATIWYTVKLKAKPEREARPSTVGKDLCPKCLEIDRAAAAARKAARAKQIAARDAGRKARAAQPARESAA